MAQENKLELYRGYASSIAKDLENEGALAVILMGSVAQGKLSPNDIDLCVFIPTYHPLMWPNRVLLKIEGLWERYHAKVDLNVHGDLQIDSLITSYVQDPFKTIEQLTQDVEASKHYSSLDDSFCIDLTSAPLRFMLDDAPYETQIGLQQIGLRMFNEKFEVLYGVDYIEQKKQMLKIKEI